MVGYRRPNIMLMISSAYVRNLTSEERRREQGCNHHLAVWKNSSTISRTVNLSVMICTSLTPNARVESKHVGQASLASFIAPVTLTQMRDFLHRIGECMLFWIVYDSVGHFFIT